MSVNLGMSSSEKDAYGAERQLGLGELPLSDYAPRFDLIYRLADMMNQSGAQENLLFGGAGYGGSFESADQKAARAKGEYLNPKPYGGWGGYGSENPVLQSGPATPAPTRTQGTDVVPGGTSGGGGTPSGWTGGRAGGGTGATPAPSTGGMPVPGGGVGMPYSGEMPTSQASAQVVDGGNMTYRDALAKQDQNPITRQILSRPDVQSVYSKLESMGVPYKTSSSALLEVAKGLENGLTPDQIVGHYSGKAALYGGDWAKMSLAGHHANWRLPKETIAGIKAGKDMSQTGWTDPRWGQDAEMPQPAATSARVAMSSPYSAFETPAMSSSATVPEMASSTNTVDPSKGFWDTLQSGVSQITQSPAFAEWVKQQSWNKQPAATNKATSAPVSGGMNVTEASQPKTYQDEEGNWWEWDERIGSYVPAKPPATTNPPNNSGGWAPEWGGSGGSNNWDNSGGGGGGGGGNTGNTGEKNPSDLIPAVQVTPEDPYNDPNRNMPTDAEGHYLGAQSIINPQFGDPVYRWKTKDPVTGETIYTNQYAWEFQQGQNPGATSDKWSTSATWRPEEPTGGVYGALSELAGGKLTDYENQIGRNWQDMYDNPNTPADDEYKNLLTGYQRTPGKGIDEAYGAYNRMLQGNGYSDAEKGAIEGSAVRGVTQGYQRNADELRRQAARTGNANAAYAALAQGGATYGSQLGEINRQNQIKFADEAQRRQEVGGQGMTNVASLANQKAQFGLTAGSDYAKEMARRKETAARGMGDYAAFGRGLQQQGISGLSNLLQQQQQSKQNLYSTIAALLNQNTGSVNKGSSTGFGVGVGVGAGG